MAQLKACQYMDDLAELLKGWGLDQVTHLGITFDLDSIPVADARFFITKDQASEVIAMLKKYELREIGVSE
ncbi:MAG: hypothetical protein WC657_06955 [Candidatus Paceibacterota bacterium]|jgi:hypothetical protein